ncbi:uncharacterized protein LOC136070126 [Quercus suber]|uniref:uncharacterized protein LOC136070126 n=1 Tax=Quercus suber TaxID=58331 RepID=UPI0032DFB573
MHEGETLKAYSDRYWEMFNDMEGNFDAMALDTFKLGLPIDHGLRTSLFGKPVTNMRQLMDRIKKYKRVKEDQQQGKGKDKVIPQERKDFRSDRYNNNKPWRDFAGQSGSANAQAVNTVFNEPVHQVLEKIKNEPFFRWPSKMVGNLERRNHNLYCQYHQDHGHTTEDCRSLWDHLDQLVREGKLRHLLHHSSGRGGQMNFEPQRDDFSKPLLGTINVIFAVLGRTGSWPSKVMSVARLPTGDFGRDPRRARPVIQPFLGFSDEDKIGTIQPHDDALVVTLRIGGYDVKRVMVDQGSVVEIMYPDLYRGLNLKSDDLTLYCSPLVSFKGGIVTPKGQIRLPVHIGSEVVEIDFIVVDVFFQVGSQMPQLEKEELIDFLKRNIDVFAWSAYKALEVDPEFIYHHLKVNPLIVPKKQPPRRPSKEHADAVKEEVTKLKQARAIKEVFYPEWLANTVVVKKKSGK